MSKHQYYVTFMASPALELMWAGSEEVEVDREPAHLNDTDHLAEAVRRKLGLLDDTKIIIMAAEKGKKKRRGGVGVHPSWYCGQPDDILR